MRDYGKISPQFWIGKTGKEIKQLGLVAQVTAMYLLTCPHASMLGVYYLPLNFISHETGIPFKGASKALRSLYDVDFCTYDEELEFVWVHNMALYQIGGPLKPNDNRVKSVNDIYQKLPNLPFLPRFFAKYKEIFWLEKIRSFEEPTKSLQSQEQEEEQEKKRIPISGNFKSQAIEVLEFLNEKTCRVYRPVDSNLKLIIARLKSGATVTDCRQVIAKKTREWKGDAKMAEYLRPATLFNATKFEQYIGELVVQREENHHE